jgi:hypothetical protein
MSILKGKFGKTEILQFGLLIGFVFLGYYMWASRDITAVRRNPKRLPQKLQDLYKILKDKGYNPETSPVSFSGYFIAFKVGDIQIQVSTNVLDANQLNVTFFTDPLTPPYVATYKDGFLRGKNGVVEDSDLLNAILQTIENKDINE